MVVEHIMIFLLGLLISPSTLFSAIKQAVLLGRKKCLSPHTVNGYIHSIFGKLALNSRSAATRFALEHHLA